MFRSRLVIASTICILSLRVYWAGSERGRKTDRRHQILQATQALQAILLPTGSPARKLSSTPPHGSPVAGQVSSPFGMRFHPRYKRFQSHRGVDIAAPVGSQVMATADGWGHSVDDRPEGYGLFIERSHPGSGHLTLYAHLSLVHVRVGQAVTRGHVIAFTGETGNALGPHLHYEVKTAHGKHMNPLSIPPAP